MMDFMDHGLPARLAGGMLSEAHVTWTFVPDDGEAIEFTWDLGHQVTATKSEGLVLDVLLVGDPNKATTSRRTVENSIRSFLDERYKA